MAARATVRNTGSKSITATRVAGSEPLKDQHAEKSVEPAARRLVHATLRQCFRPVSGKGHGACQRQCSTIPSNCTGLWSSTDGRNWRANRGCTPRDTLIDTSWRRSGSGSPARSLTPGAQLPSIRAFATDACRSPNPPSSKPMSGWPPKASSARGPGSGFYVAGPLAPLSLAEIGPKLDRAIDPFWVSRQSLDAGDDDAEARLRLAAGVVDAAEALRRALRTLARAPTMPTLADYGTPLGLPPLRQLLARRMARARHRGLARTDHADGIRHAGHRPALPLPDRARRYGAGRRPLLFQLPRAAARPPRQDRRRARTRRSGPDIELFAQALPSIGRASTSPTPPSITRPARRCRRSLRIACSSSPTRPDLTIVEDDIFADFERDAGAPARRLRRPAIASSISAASRRRCRPRCAAASSPRRRDWIEA